MTTLDKILVEAVYKAATERGHINILVAGRSGVGKSTLINSVFHSNIAETGHGRPVTKCTREISKEGNPLTIFDTRGLELSEYKQTISELGKLVSERSLDKDVNRHIHLAWLCVQEDGRRVEEAESALHDMLAERVPVVAIITKARADNGFRAEVQRLLPQARNVVRVRAIGEEFDTGMKLEPMGLETLVELSSELIPEGQRRAFSAAQKASIKYKDSQAQKVVATATTAAAAAGASPIPLSDVALLAPIQIGMLAGITATFGLELSKGTLSTLLSSALGVTASAFAGRAIVSTLLKFIPGGGSIVGGAISGATAATLTMALGMAYISVLTAMCSESPQAAPSSWDIKEIGDRLKAELRTRISGSGAA